MKQPTSEQLIKFCVSSPDSGGGFVDEPNLYKALGTIEIRTSTLKEKCDFYIGELVLARMQQLDYCSRVADGLERAVQSGIAAKSGLLNQLIEREVEKLVRERVAVAVAAMSISVSVNVK